MMLVNKLPTSTAPNVFKYTNYEIHLLFSKNVLKNLNIVRRPHYQS